MPVPEQNPTGPEQFGPYELYERLGMGGMATVYRAKKRGPEGFERSVALKRMLQHLAEDSTFVDGFIREAKVASMLSHPNIAQVYDFGRINAVYYIAMELVAGSDLRRLLRYANRLNEPIPLPVVFSLLGELCDALEYAHTFVDEHGTPLNIVHRDISPSNLIVAHTGHLKVIDFGIAKASSRNLRTETGMVKGKLGYMAPEVALGMSVTPAADVFSMGVVAWELITASPLFTGRTDFETMSKLREGEIAPPSRHNPVCPPELDQLVMQAVDRDVERRLPSAGVFRRGLDTIAARHGIAVSARAVVDWMQTLPPLQDAWRPGPSAPGEAQTAMLRPVTGTKLRRSSEEIEHASDIWGEDAMSVQSASSGPQAAHYAVGTGGHHGTGGQYATGGQYGTGGQYAAGGQYGTGAPPQTGVQPARKWPWIALATLVVGGGAVAGYFVSHSSSAPPVTAVAPAPVPAPAPANTHGSLRFAIEPANAVIEIGGKEVGRSSPFDIDLDPGVYTVAVHADTYKPWSGTLTVTSGERQTIDIALDRADVVASTAPSDAGTRHAHVTISKIEKHAQTVAPTPDPAPVPEPTPTSPPPKPDPTPPPPPPPKPDPTPTPEKPARVAVVGANAVTKLSGELPHIKSDGAGGDVIAKLCIDEQGRVTSAKIVRSPAGVGDQLAHAFDSWRYKPYVNQQSKPSAVCFPVTVHLVVQHPD